jgi:hypothetical protein
VTTLRFLGVARRPDNTAGDLDTAPGCYGIDGPDVCGYCDGVGQVDDGDRLCPECLGEGRS